MGIMVDGEWQTEEFAKRNRSGRYVRVSTQFRDIITADGSSGFPAEIGRYHLVVAHACPWAHRTLILRALKGLHDVISVAYVDPLMRENGWTFGGESDPVTGVNHVHELYAAAAPGYSGRCSVPVLWDTHTSSIVNNESADIVRMLNAAFNSHASQVCGDLYPPALRPAIDEVNELVYERVNNGVYKCGFATTQVAYDEAFSALFGAMDELEKRLSLNRYLTGAQVTEADWRLFPTLIRFDVVYFGHFKCNRQRLADYPNLSSYLRELYQWSGIAATMDFTKTKQHYYGSQESINPFRIVPGGPQLDFDAPHDRTRLEAK
ncbi:MAG: glutathione S-transferase family protein [Chromatiales bacterium]|jgi:glutathionyl-hydroquinone reductase|nr:glutathione S-transferase family protein [Chromatiales bacterium]